MAETDGIKVAIDEKESLEETPSKRLRPEDTMAQDSIQEDGKVKTEFGLARQGKLPDIGYEYLDHTADIQIHAWGKTIEKSFEQACVAMFGYMTDLTTVSIDETKKQSFEVEGHDLQSLLYNLMDEFLFRFSTEDFVVCKDVKITEFNTEDNKITVEGYGESFDLAKHPQGTEIKAITYSAMQIHADRPTNDVYVIVDI